MNRADNTRWSQIDGKGFNYRLFKSTFFKHSYIIAET